MSHAAPPKSGLRATTGFVSSSAGRSHRSADRSMTLGCGGDRGSAYRRVLALSLLLLVFVTGCSSGGGTDQAGVTKKEIDPPSTTTTSGTTTTSAMSLPIEGPCELDMGGTVEEQLAQACIPSCMAALSFADAATNPALNDVFHYAAAYLRLTTAQGTEPSVGDLLPYRDAVVELLGAYVDDTDPNAPELSGSHTRWGLTSALPTSADVIYDAYGIIGEDEVPVEFEISGAVLDHPLRELAQFMVTPLGCLSNPHRSEAAVAPSAERPPSTSTTQLPTTTSAAAPATTITPLQRYDADLQRIGEEITGGALADKSCEQTSPSAFDCVYHEQSGYTYLATVVIAADGSLTYEVTFSGGGA